ncbi:protein of unknown function DUF192 [Thalassoporum mexicanum PCC 7367]|uniref:DUF192 domain-containing protein n=1 Tax=Thalassoporum mexicanum TaxID=3457544 RepID=UPI00029FFB0F|nr:DUF192 domain-containing protein [Pseudanabaena sp. PCC 7367]AFY71384.1 protein of unknown function DUF192 [Pseudanabaena sp. PCC 7367]
MLDQKKGLTNKTELSLAGDRLKNKTQNMLVMMSNQVGHRLTQPHRGLVMGVALASILLIGCANPKSSTTKLTTMPQIQTSQNEQSAIAAAVEVDRQKAQFLPITATATIADQVIELEVTRTPQQQALGLMFRPELPADRGMLFDFQPAKQVAFWMKNVPVNLDMIFLLNDQVVAIEHSVPPCTSEPCAIYPSTPILADRVIELRTGRAQELGIKVGDQIKVTALDASD